MISALMVALAAMAPCDKLSPAAPAADTLPWHGVFALNRSESDDLDEVVEQATRQVRRRMRGRVESALRERLQGSACLRLTSDSALITIESERSVVWRVDRQGTAESGAPRASGRKVPATVTDREINIAGQGERGEARYHLSREADGKRLRLAVYLKPERLDEPISYTLVYDAKAAPARQAGEPAR